jgi:uridine kinase
MADQTLDIESLRDVVDDNSSGRPGPLLLGVDGRGGSGKSTLARLLEKTWPDTQVIEMDDFYLPVQQRPNNPAPLGGNFDLTRLKSQILVPLAAGHSARYQRYDWEADTLAEWHDVTASRYVIVEGVYSTIGTQRTFYDYRVWVDAPYDVRLSRGIARDGEGMRKTWVEVWMPAEDRYVAEEAPAAHADLVVSGAGAGASPVFHVVSQALREPVAGRQPGRSGLIASG